MPQVPAKEYWTFKEWKSLKGSRRPRRAGRQSADGALHRATAFAKEHWILKD